MRTNKVCQPPMFKEKEGQSGDQTPLQVVWTSSDLDFQ